MKVVNYKKGMKIEPPCLVLGMPNEIYHEWPDSISNSGLTLIARSPAHYFYKAKKETTRHMEIGTALHTALLEPHVFKEKYVLLRDIKVRTASEYKQAAKTHGGEYVLTGPESDGIMAMVESVYANPDAGPWLRSDGYREASLFVNDPETGVLVRVRYDLLTLCGTAIDIKKTQDAREEKFSKSIYEYRYHVQDAIYSDAYEWATGKPLEAFRFLAIEQEMPHANMVYRLDDFSRSDGRRLYREALNKYAECIKSNNWKSYESTGDNVISLPDWYLRRLEDELELDFSED